MSTKQENSVIEKVDITLPEFYKVVMHNDDTTSLELVVMILTSVFEMDVQKAIEKAMEAHSSGSAVIGSFVKSKAEKLKAQGMQYARTYGYEQFTLTIEKDT